MVKVVALAVSNDRASSDAAFQQAAQQLSEAGRLLILYARPAKVTDVKLNTPNQVIRYKTYTLPVEEMYNKQSQEILGRYAELAKQAKLDFETMEVEGSSDEAIPAKCTEMEADVLVIGAAARNALQKLFLGSSSNKIIAKAPCPVLVVKAEAKSSTSRNAAGRIEPLQHSLLQEQGN